MDKVFKIMIGAIFVILIIGCLGMLYAEPTPTYNENCTYNLIKEKINEYQYKSFDPDDPNIEIIEKDYIYGARDYPMYKVTYRDGEFRQFNAETGELIGSSYQSDQAQLGNPNGERE